MRRGRDRAIAPLTAAELQQMPTGALLARLKRLRWCEESAASSDMSPDEIAAVDDMILFKDTDIWRDAYRDLKQVLAGREHLDKP